MGIATYDYKVPLPRKVDADTFSGNVISALASDLFTVIIAAATTLPQKQTLYNDPKTNPDVDFVNDDGSFLLHAHTNILCAKSTYFDEHFQHPASSSNNTLRMTINHPQDVFKKFIKFLYEIEPEDVGQNEASDLLEAAIFYGVSDLKIWCCNVLEESLLMDKQGTKETCIGILEKHDPAWLNDHDLPSTTILSDDLIKWLRDFRSREDAANEASRKRKTMNEDSAIP